MNKIKKGDEVVVNTGKDKGKKGKVSRVMIDRVFVEGINLSKKHVKANPNANTDGGIELKTMSIHISNVNLYDPTAKSKSRIGIRRLKDGNLVRYYKASNELVDIKN